MKKTAHILSLSNFTAPFHSFFSIEGVIGVIIRCVILPPILLVLPETGNADDQYKGINNRPLSINAQKKNRHYDSHEPRRVIIRLKQGNQERTNNRRLIRKKIDAIAGLKKEAKSTQKKLIRFLENRGNQNHRYSQRQRITREAPRSFWVSNCIAITATPEEIEKIEGHPDVEEVIENVILSIPPIEVNATDESMDMDLWNHTLIGMDEIKALGLDGSNIRVGHLDTGIDTDNPELKGKLIAWAEFGLKGEKIESQPHDTHYLGHGTHTATVIAGETTGIAPGVSLISAMILEEGHGTILQALAGMQWVLDPDNDISTDDGAQIVNMSWGAWGTSELLNEAIKNMRDAGVLPVAAIGNYGYDITLSPGNTPDAVGVGAVNQDDGDSAFSGGGDVFWDDLYLIKPDIAAPGVKISGMGINGRYQSMSGTSFAAPHVTGAAALLLELSPDLKLSQIKSFLYNTALDLGKKGLDTRYGYGRLDIASAVDFLLHYKNRIGASDLILQTIREVDGITAHQFKTLFSNGDKILPLEYTETPLSYSERTPIGLSDVNGDGFSDIVTSGSTYIGNEYYHHQYQVYLSKEGKGFTGFPETWFSDLSRSPDACEIIGLGDVDGDKRSDIIYINKTSMPYGGEYCDIKVLRSLENNRFSDDAQLWSRFYNASYYTNNFRTGDMNGDGMTDLILEQKSNYSIYTPVSYKVGLSDGTRFRPLNNKLTEFYSHYSMDSTLSYMKDVNGDGCEDLIFTSRSYSSPNSVSIFVATANGASNFNTRRTWCQVRLDRGDIIAGMGDINRDGAWDIIEAHHSDIGYQLRPWLSNGKDRFSQALSPWFETGSIPYDSIIQLIGIANTGIGNWNNQAN